MGRIRIWFALLAALVCTVAFSFAQTASRRATSVASVLIFPNFFHGQQVVLTGELTTKESGLVISGPEDLPALHVVLKGATSASGLVEVAGQFIDVGRLESGDPRLTDEAVQPLLPSDERRPKQGEVLVLLATRVTPASPPTAPSVRTIALDPARYADQHVTITGQFRGRNLYGDLPQAPGISKWDFVLRAADAAIWVTGLEPKGKGYNLDPAARVDTSRWLDVSGAVRYGRGLVWIEANQFALAKPVETDEAPVAVKIQGISPEVIFSAPTEGETDVELATTVRIQFSRDLDALTVKDQVKVSYVPLEATERGEMAPPSIKFTANYVSANRVLEIRFASPLERFRTVKVELSPDIAAFDGAPLKPWTLTFALGGS